MAAAPTGSAQSGAGAAMPYMPRSPCSRSTSSREIRFSPSEQPRDEADLGEVLDRLHLVVRGHHRPAAGHRAVVGEQQPVVRLDVLADGRRQLRGRRRAVLGDRNAAQRGDHLGEHRARQRDAGDGKPGGQSADARARRR